MGHVTKPTGRTVLATPDDFVARCAAKLGIPHFDLDAAALDGNRKAPDYLGPDHIDPARRDALTAPTWGDSGYVWLNPPYGRGITARWAKEAAYRATGERLTVCALLPGDSRGAAWWHRWVLAYALSVWDVRGRISFIQEDGTAQRGNQFNSAVVVWRGVRRGTCPRLDTIEAR